MRAADLADVIIDRLPGVSSMKLQKILYYSHAWHLAITDEPLVDEQFEAWPNGPVIDTVWRERKANASRVPHRHLAVTMSPLAAGIVEMVCRRYGNLSGDELSRLTHGERPWVETRGNLPEHARTRKQIPNDTIAAYYREHRDLAERRAEDIAAAGILQPLDPDADHTLDIDAILQEVRNEMRELPAETTRRVVQGNLATELPDVSYEGIRTARVR